MTTMFRLLLRIETLTAYLYYLTHPIFSLYSFSQIIDQFHSLNTHLEVNRQQANNHESRDNEIED